MEELYGLKKENCSNKDKTVIVKKLDKLESMMYEFLGIVKIQLDEDRACSILEFVQGQIKPDTEMEDIQQFSEVLEALVRKIGHPSKLWEEGNIPSLIAVVAWSFENDTDLDKWFVDYCGRNDTYLSDQAENFMYMRDDLEQFTKAKAAA